MTRLFEDIRWRQVGWTMLILSLLLVFLGIGVYVAAGRSLLDQVDRNLDERSRQAPLALGPGRGPQLEQRAGYHGGVFYLVIAPDGSVLVNPQQVDIAGTQIQVPTGRAPTYSTIELDGELARIHVRADPRGVTLVVGQSLRPELEALRSLLVTLVAGGALGLLLSFGAAWFLAGRALVPIQQAFRRQQEFTADASHELRTPLTVLRSATDLLAQRRDEPLANNGELFDDVRAEIARMERIAADLLTLARSDRGELELMVAPIDLAELAADVVRRTAPLAQEGQIELALRPPTDPLPDVEADPDRLQQVLLILLDNAIKHTPPNGRVEVRVERDGSEALLRVVDTGSGIAPEHLPRIFDRFYRVDTARSRERGGTGLGLAIARMLVDAHGGKLSISSTVGVGTQVTLRLPMEPGADGLGHRLGALASRVSHAAARD